MGLDLPQPETTHLLSKGSQLGHPLSELGGHIPVQPCLIDKVVPILLVFMKEPGFLPTVSNKRLKKDSSQKTKIDEEKRDREAGPSQYPIGGNDYISKDATGLVQSFLRGHEPLAKLLPLHALDDIIEGEEFRGCVPRTYPLEQGLIPRGQVVAL